jgi:hypothetical protein
MPTGESAGGIFVTISGDNSPLLAVFASTESQARAAGQRIAAAFGTAFGQSGGIVDQFGNSIRSNVIAPTEAAQEPVDGLAGAIKNLTAALAESSAAQADNATAIAENSAATSLAIQRNEALARSSNGAAIAARGMGMALRPFIFIEVGRIVYEAAQNAIGLADALKQVAESAKQADSAMSQMVSTIDSANVKRIGDEFGAAAGQMANAKKLGADAQDALSAANAKLIQESEVLNDSTGAQDFFGVTAAKVQALENDIDGLNAKYVQLSDASNAAFDNSKKIGAEEAGSLAAARIAATESFNQRQSAMDRATVEAKIADEHAAVQAHIDAGEDKIAASLKTADEEVRIAKEKQAELDPRALTERNNSVSAITAKGSADSQGQDVVRQAQIYVETLAAIQAANDKYAASTQATAIAVATAVAAAENNATIAVGKAIEARRALALKELADSGKLANEQARAQGEAAQKAAEAATRQANLTQRTGQLGIQTQGAAAEGANSQAKIAAQAAYEQNIVHSKSEQLAYAREMAEYDEKSLQIKIGIAQLEMVKATLENNAVPTALGRLKISEDQLKVEQAITALKDKQDIDAAAAANPATNNPFANLGGAIANAPEQLAGNIGSDLFGPHGGKNQDIGEQIRKSLQGIGKEMMGDVFKDLIAATVGNTLAHIGSTIATDVNTAATELNTFWLAIKSFLGGFFADGGSPPVGVPSIVGERGPELFVPHTAGTIIPNVPSSGGVGSSSFSNSARTSNQSLSIGAIHLHNVSNAKQVARDLPDVLKRQSPQFSPLSS